MTGSTSTASERIHADLRRAILAGTYEPGEALPSERRLAEDLGASRHVVREALKRLQQAGLVTISQGGATKVRDWRRHGGLDLLLDVAASGDVPAELHAARAGMEMRACIGADAARRAAVRASDTARSALRDRATQLAAVDDLAARNAHYEVLWDQIVEAADNLAYRLALTTLISHQRIADLGPEAVRAELADDAAIGALVRAIAEADADLAHQRARDLLERSIPES
jgi:DNA-binding FadR family transcriptional regulator